MIIVLMGVAGSGKTTLGQKLALALGCPFYDADDFHPGANKEKMGRGVPLTDGDRQPWLEILAGRMKEWEGKGPVTVLACSALKQRYRDRLAREVPVRWVYLKGEPGLLRQRLEARQGHYAKAALLESQLAALEEPSDALTLEVDRPADFLVDGLVQKLKES